MRRLVAVLLVGGLAGCMVGPDYRRPEVPVPGAFGEIAAIPSPRADGKPPETSRPVAGGIPEAWWEAFGDPLLASLITRTVASNLDLAQAEARVRQARAQRKIVASSLYPQIGASGGYAREHTSGNSPGFAEGRTLNLFQTGFDANWEIDVFGGIRRSVESAEATIQATVADRDAILISLMGEVGLEYVTYRSLQQRIRLANDNLRSQEETLALTQRLYDAGLAAELDVQRAAAQVSTTAATIPVLVQQREQSMHALAILVGQLPMTLQAELEPVGPIPEPPLTVGVGLPSDLLLRRPDVARSERQLAAATANIGVATRDLFPRFFLVGAAGLQSIAASDLFTWQSRAASIGPQITWPVFEGGRIRANIELQNAAQEEAFAAYQQTVLRAFQDVEDSLVAFSGAQAQRAQLEDAVRANQRATDLARRLYAQGLTDFLDVLVAEQALFTSQDALAQSRRDVALGLVSLYKALGGGWETDAAATPPTAFVAR
jgi:multidrug efflux system outer membrane protein